MSSPPGRRLPNKPSLLVPRFHEPFDPATVLFKPLLDSEDAADKKGRAPQLHRAIRFDFVCADLIERALFPDLYGWW